MTVTITDPAALATLAHGAESVEVRDPNGRLLGRLTPSFEATLKLFGLTHEEYERRRNVPDSECVPTAAVLERLRTLTKQS